MINECLWREVRALLDVRFVPKVSSQRLAKLLVFPKFIFVGPR